MLFFFLLYTSLDHDCVFELPLVITLFLVYLLIDVTFFVFSVKKAIKLKENVGRVLALSFFIPSPGVFFSLRDSQDTTRMNSLFWFVIASSIFCFFFTTKVEYLSDTHFWGPLIFAGIFLVLQFFRGDHVDAQIGRIICTVVYMCYTSKFFGWHAIQTNTQDFYEIKRLYEAYGVFSFEVDKFLSDDCTYRWALYFMALAVTFAILNFVATNQYWHFEKSVIKKLLSSMSSKKRCPFCGEKIRKGATLCRFCGKELPVAQTAQNTESEQGSQPDQTTASATSETSEVSDTSEPSNEQ